MQRRTIGLLVLLALGLLFAPLSAHAQPPAKGPRIGVLATYDWPPFGAFRQGLHDLGYIEGHNLVLEYRWTEGKNDRFPALAAELVGLQVDVIVTWGRPAAQAAQHATSTIPIVMAAIADLVGTGLVASLARSGGNITGLSAHHPELEGKRLELLKEALPALTRVALLWNPDNPTHPVAVQETQHAARALGVHLQPVEAPGDTHFAGAFDTMARERAEALIVAGDTVFVFHRTRLAELAAQHRLPAIYLHKEHAQAGGLMAYSASYPALFRRAASYVDKILKGTKPADLPVEQPTKFELVINLNTAQVLGLPIPPTLLFLVDEVLR
jgi:putative ABC transport system substrate-binding protein